jgi:steroid Delta-isomerase
VAILRSGSRQSAIVSSMQYDRLMPGPAVATLKKFGEVEDDQRYTRLLELFTDDAIYYDPFMGAQRGKDEIFTFMQHMEKVVPAAGVRFDSWEVEADTACGWARWSMVVPSPAAPNGEVPIDGQSLYRLRDGKVCFVADYLDPIAYANLRAGKVPDLTSPAGMSASFAPSTGKYPALDLVKKFWRIQDDGDYAKLSPLFADDAVFTDIIYGEMVGGQAIADYMIQMKTEMPAKGVTFELVDCAGDTTVAWSQWWAHFPNGSVPGWTLHTVRGDQFTLDADYFDRAASKALRSAK